MKKTIGILALIVIIKLMLRNTNGVMLQLLKNQLLIVKVKKFILVNVVLLNQ